MVRAASLVHLRSHRWGRRAVRTIKLFAQVARQTLGKGGGH